MNIPSSNAVSKLWTAFSYNSKNKTPHTYISMLAKRCNAFTYTTDSNSQYLSIMQKNNGIHKGLTSDLVV